MNKLLIFIRLEKEKERQCRGCKKIRQCICKENVNLMERIINRKIFSDTNIPIIQTRIKYLSLLEGACTSYVARKKE